MHRGRRCVYSQEQVTPTLYKIYEAVSPSGKRYVGMTRTSVEKRWYSHVRRARVESGRHPLWDAIRKYGGDAFVVATLAEYETEAEATAAEHIAIWVKNTTSRAHGYNISEGHDFDASSGAAAMRERMADPAWRAQYLVNLSAGIRATYANRDVQPQLQGAVRWRRENPRLARKIQMRGSRCAQRALGVPPGAALQPVAGSWGRLWIPGDRVLKARRRYFSRKRALAQWANRDEAQRAAVGAAIAESVREAHKREGKPERDAQLAAARNSINRAKQGAAAAKGLRDWWARIKTDPEAYRTLMEGKKEKLRARRKNV